VRRSRRSAVRFFGGGYSLGRQQADGRAARCWRAAGSRGLAGALTAVVLVAAAAADYALLGHEAPDFALHAVGGANVRLSEHRGDVVVLSFWSSRCGQCRMQLTALERSFKTYHPAGLQVYGVDVDDDQSGALEFAHAQALGFPLLLDPGKAVARAYRVDNLPMTVLIDRSGSVRQVHRDLSSKFEPAYLQQLRALLNE
jgi:peroxiredoxin